MENPQHSVQAPSVEVADLHVPPLDEVAAAIENGLKGNFLHAEVQVVDCPDLTKEPFHLAASGLSGDPSLVDLGGVPYLIPSVRRDKIYDLAEIPSLIDFRKNESDSVMMIGAGAGPWFHVGTNCELMLNLSISGRGGPAQDETGVRNFSRLATVHQKEHRQQQLPADQTKCALLVNFLVSKGEMSKVLRVECSKRTGSENFITCIRQTLNQHYPDKAIGLGGTFIIDNGKAKLHIMPDFSSCPLETNEQMDNWLHFYEATGPLVALSTLVSRDPASLNGDSLDLRMEHSHCFSLHGDAGHYHYDVSPDTIKYYGYFVVAEKIYRIDRPTVTHLIGRD